MSTVEHRLDKLERLVPCRGLADVRDVSELTTAELSFHFLEGLPSASDLQKPEWATLRDSMTAEVGKWASNRLPDPIIRLPDQIECFIAHCLADLLDLPTSALFDGYRQRFPQRVIDAAIEGHRAWSSRV